MKKEERLRKFCLWWQRYNGAWEYLRGRKDSTAMNYRMYLGVDLTMSIKKEGYFEELRAYKP